MTSTIILALITAVALSAAFFVYHKVSGALQKMDEMLDAAIDGSFAEQIFRSSNYPNWNRRCTAICQNRKHRNARWKPEREISTA